MIETTLLILKLLAGVQREKGLALLCSVTEHPNDQDAFHAQMARNEALLSQVHDSGNASLYLQTPKLLSHFEDRPSLLMPAGDHQELLDWYAFRLENPIRQSFLQLLPEWPGLSPTQTSATIHLLAALNYLVQIRDAGVMSYARGGATTQDIAHLKTLALSFLARERLFLNLADAKLRTHMDDLKVSAAELQALFDSIIRKLKDGYAKGVLAETALHDWEQTFDEVHKDLAGALDQSLMRFAKDEVENQATASGINALETDVEQQLPIIAALPLFRGVSETTLRHILSGARILQLDKNLTFLTQGEPFSKLFIIMDGWVKTLKSTADGEEAILQIVGKRDPLLDHGTLSGGVAGFSARTVTRSRVLSISLPSLREQVSRHHDLAQNLLSATSSRLQKLVSQYEQITLRTATERVGWFLVNLYLETGLEGAPLELPYDKALIAAYLNIKPETFSRVLQQFRKDGFKIDKHKVVMPHPQALCSYCDPDLALRCCRAEAVQCAPIRAALRTETK